MPVPTRPLRFFCLLILHVLMAGCESKSRPEDVQRITELTYQLDTLVQRATFQRQTIQYMQSEIREAAVIVAEYEAQRNPNRRRAITVAPPVGVLYHQPELTKLKNLEMAEVLSSADTVVTLATESYSVRAYSVCNGPGDTLMESCNCSHYLYIAACPNDFGDEYEYYIYRAGPFFSSALTTTKEGDGSQIIVQYDIRGQKRTDVFRISDQGVDLQKAFLSERVGLIGLAE